MPVDRYFQPPSATTKTMSARSPAATAFAADAERGVQGGAGGDAGEDALLLEEFAGAA